MTTNQPIELVGVEEEKRSFNLSAIRSKLANTKGKQYWRSLDEIAETPEFQSYLHHEFPHWAERIIEPVTRRNFLKFMGASLALAGLSGCTANSVLHPQPLEKIAPYTKQPEQLVQGKPMYYATSMTLGGFAKGLLVESHMGRPTKVEGNPDHPASLGASDAFAQASILTMYDPERAQAVKYRGRISSWSSFLQAINQILEPQRAGGNGAGLSILTETITSPTLANQFERLLEMFPNAKWHQYEPVNRDNLFEGAVLAFGEYVNTYYDFTKAKVILSLGSNFLADGPSSTRYARDFADQRRVASGQEEMNRLYVLESSPTGTGSVADNRLPLTAAEIEIATRHLANLLGVVVDGAAEFDDDYMAWLAAVAEDLQSHSGATVIIPGERQSPAVHALAHAMNAALNNIGSTVVYTEPVEANPVNQVQSLHELVDDIDNGQVDTLIVLGGNPAFTAPADFNFADKLSQIEQVVHLTLYENETSVRSHWVIPQTEYLETWSDARAYDGTVSLIQPLIAPLYGGFSAHQLLAVLLDQGKDPYDILHSYWEEELGGDEFDVVWKTALHDGLMADTALPAVSVSLFSGLDLPPAPTNGGVEVTFAPDGTIWDGRYANNGWLQEAPKPMTRLTWDNAALISPALADEYGLSNGDIVHLKYGEFSFETPVWIQPGQAKKSIALSYGYGRKQVGQVGQGTGFNVYEFRTSDALTVAADVELNKTGGYYDLVSTQNHSSMEGRDIIRAGTLEQYLNAHGKHHEHEYPSLMPEYTYDGHQWGMSIDLTNCIGCNACVMACNAENNIAIVGKEEVSVGREMHWLRIDRYFEGDLDNPNILHQPMMCQHCEQAPCEIVCPVAATVHSAEGLNDMVYNRCVGTRFCANNCPYKVRRYNFYQYQELDVPVIELRHNPEVTVRSRGVMEKCSYCVQRINHARIEAKKSAVNGDREEPRVHDGEVVTACQQACSTQAIVFGDINDEMSKVRQLRDSDLNYSLLAELNTHPRTTYLKRITNPNPAIEHDSEVEHGDY